MAFFSLSLSLNRATCLVLEHFYDRFRSINTFICLIDRKMSENQFLLLFFLLLQSRFDFLIRVLYMSPAFLPNPMKMCPSLDSSSSASLANVSLNNTQIRTFINIFPPTPIPPNIDPRKYSPSNVSTQALYHYYFPHLFSLQSASSVSSSSSGIDRTDNKRTLHQSNSLFRIEIKRKIVILIDRLCFLVDESLSSRKRKQITPGKRFDFAKLADEAVKDKEEVSNSSRSSDAGSNQISSSVVSTPSPAAITSGVSLLASTTP